MESNTFYHEILIDHNQHPVHKHKLEDANLVLEGVNPSCGDDIILQLKVEDGKDHRRRLYRGWMCDFPGIRRYHAGAYHW